MSGTKQVMTIKDTITFVLNEADLTGKKVGEALRTPPRRVPCSDGLVWGVQWYPAGNSAENETHVSLCLLINKMVSVDFNFHVAGSSLQLFVYSDFVERNSYGIPQFASHEKLRPFFIDGKLSITCEANFTFAVPFICRTPRLTIYGNHVPTDFELIVGSNVVQLQVHKSLISLMSPVFHAMLSHDTVESKSGKVEITDFDFETVSAAIDFCYGAELGTPSIETVVGVLRFADKYAMQSVTDQLAKIPRFNLSVETFPAIVHYADDCSDGGLFDECCQFFKEHQNVIRATENFCQLPPSLVAHLLEETFELETQFDILRHANSNGIDFILTPLERPIIEALSLDTFCNTVSYVWECSRDDLKDACAKFFNDNQAEIRMKKEFYDLSPQVIYGVMKLGFEILIADQ